MIDGPTLLEEALASPVDIVEVYAEPAAPTDAVGAARARDVPVRSVSAGSLAKVTSPVTPQPVAALASIPVPAPIEQVGGLVLVLVGVADPGNAGTLFRIAEAAGATAVVSCADAVDVWNPKCVRAAAGSLFRIPHVAAADVARCIADLRAAGMTVLASAAGAGAAHDTVDLRGDVAVLLGNEAHGLDPTTVSACDGVITVPMAGAVESLNVAMTGAVIAFDAARQRRASTPGVGPST